MGALILTVAYYPWNFIARLLQLRQGSARLPSREMSREAAV